jgi:hypothetical protein
MKSIRITWASVVAFLAFAAAPACATDEHDYARDEYAIIRDGLAPDERMSLASHADPEIGGNGVGHNFHIWLMAEPAHRRLAPLPDIGPEALLDSGPQAYRATWAPDSRHVAVNFRSDRHVLELDLYAIENRGARLISGPTLFRDVTSRNVGPDENFGHRVAWITWTSPRHFLLHEHHLFQASDPGALRKLGAYGKATGKLVDGRLMVEFSAEADCVVLPGHRYRIVDLRVGKFGED